MPQISYRANLSSAIFPLSLSAAGRTVIVPGPDNNYDRRVDPEGEQKDAGIPQAIYLENVIPTANGYQSAGYLEQGPKAPGTIFAANFVPYRVAVIQGYTYLFGLDGVSDLIYRTNGLDLELWSDITAYWLSYAGGPYIDSSMNYKTLSQATVRGTEYIYVRNGSFLGSVSGSGITNVSGSLSGITTADIDMILASYNYLIVIGRDNTVYWSSTTTPLDFTSSLVSGAGSIIPEAVRGDIVSAHTIPEGFILYTQTNAILASYTGNARYPWKFKEVSNSGGHTNERMIAAPQDSAMHFTINAQGTITQVSADGVSRIAPEISTYLRTSKGTLDTYNPATRTINTTLATLESYELIFIANRYLIAQFRTTGTTNPEIIPKTHIVYDTVLRRYGRLGALPLFFWDDSSNIYCYGTDGKVYEIIFDIHNQNAIWDSVIALGKFQYVRSRRLEIDEIIVEGELPEIGAAIISSGDGNMPSSGTALVASESSNFIHTYPTRAEGLHHTLAISGRFSLSSIELTFHLGGSR